MIVRYLGSSTDTAISITDTVASDTFTASTGTLSASDIDAGTTLSYGITNVTVTDGVATQVGTYGTLAVTAASGAYTFTPNAAAINALSANTTETFSVTVSDGTATTTATLTVNLTGVNDTPTVAAPASFALTEDVVGNLTYTGTPFADTDSATLTVTLTVSDGTLTGNAGEGITVAGTATARTFAGTVVNLNTYFTTAGKITYQGALNATTSQTLTTAVSDGSLSASATSTINFTAVNDAPVATAPATFALTEDLAGNLMFTGTPFADVDSATLTVTLSVTDGTITGNTGTGITVAGTAVARTFAGTVAALNTYFTTAGKVTYQGALDNTTSRTLTTAVSDGTLSASTTSTITITAVNDVPVFAVASTVSATGGTISTSGAYTIHTFTNAGTATFTPAGAMNVEVLVVGGGGSSTGAGGGGGGGGVVSATSYAVTATGYTVTVGAGGAANTASSGGNSIFGSVVGYGGGAGGLNQGSGGSGGSGGGAGRDNTGVGGSATQGTGGTAFGNAGGSGPGGSWGGGSGGGGAGAAGANGVRDGGNAGERGGAGGAGLAFSISGVSTYYGGGGGGGNEGNSAVAAGGLGGGGRGGAVSPTTEAASGTANTGGGGGGSYNSGAGGAGGSGIVIVRYTGASTAIATSITDTVASDTFTASTGTLSATDVDAGTTLSYGIANGTVASGVATKVGTYGTLAVTATTGAYTFTPNAAAINALSANTTETFSVTVSDGTAPTTATLTVNVTGVNDAPRLASIAVLTGATEDTAYEITYAALAAAADEADVDSSGLSFRVEAVSTGTLEKGGGSTWVAVTAGTTLLGANETLRWTPAANANGTSNAFTVKAWDGALASATAVPVTVQVAAVNDGPVVTAGGALAYVENGLGAVVDATVVITDGDDLQLTGAVVMIDSVVAGDVLGFASQNGLAGSYNPSTGTLTLTGTATLVQYQAALRSVTYASTSENPTVNGTRTGRTITWVVTDANTSNAANGLQTSGALNVSASYLTGTPQTLNANGANAYVIATDLGQNWTFEAEYRMTSSNGLNTLFSYGMYTDGILVRTLRGDSLYVKGNGFGLIDVFGGASTNGAFVPVKLVYSTAGSTGTLSIYAAGTLVRTASASGALNPADKTIRLGSAHHSNGEGFAGEVRNIRISNGQSGPVVSSQITLTAVNDAPTLATVSTLTGATEDTAFTITHTTLAAAADEADGDSSGLAFRIEAVSTGTLTKGGVAVTAGSTTVSSGESLAWTPAANANGTLAAFTVKAWDGELASATAVQVQVVVTAVNDAPVVTVPAAQTLPSLAGLIFGANAVAVADVDDTTLTVRLSVGSGKLTLATVAGLTFTEGDGLADAAMTIAGPLAAINAALNGLFFEVAENFAGQTTLTVVATDAGNLATTATVNLTVNDTHAPRVLALNAVTAAGHYKAGATLDLAVTFTEPVTVTTSGGTPTVRLETGAVDRTAAYVSGSGSSTLVFRYTVQAGDTSEDLNHAATTALELNGGGLADAAANAATLTLPAVTAGAVGALATNAAWVVDTTIPTVVIGAPSVVKTDTGPATFVVTYADLHAVSVTLTAADVTLIATGNALGQIAVTGTGLTRTVTISGTTGDGNMSISLAAGTARDEAGNLAPAMGPSTTFLVENILPARIVTQPVAVAATQGSTAMLSVAVSGRPTPTLQWRKSGVPIAGATLTVLARHGVIPADAGSYDVVVTNVVGPVVSTPVALTVTASPGDLFGSGLSQYGSLGDLSAIGHWTPAPLSIWPGSGTEPLIKLAAEGRHGLILTAGGKTYGLGYNYGSALGVASNQLSYPVPEVILDNVRMVAVAQSNSYFLRRDGTLWGTGSTQAGMLGEDYPGAGSVVPFPLVPGRTDIVAVWAAGASGQGGCIFLTRDGDLFLLGGPSDYEPRKLASNVIDAAEGAGFTLWVKADGSLWSYGMNTFGQLGNGTTNTSLVAESVVASGVSRVVAGQNSTFFLKQDGSLWGMGRNTFGQLGVGSTSNQLTAVQVMTGVREIALGERHAVVLKVDGSVWTMGNNYYGQLGDGSTTQRTSPVWIANHATAVAAGSYSTLYLAVTAPKIQQGPVDRAAVVGENVGLTVVATGTPTLAYVWSKDGVPVAGASGATLTLPAITTGAAGSYRVSVTNVAGTATSGVAVLIVTPVPTPPTIKTQPINRIVQAGMDVTFTAEVTGTAPLRYQWRKGGVAIVGATESSLVLRAVQFGNVGSYDLVVTNTVGNATSAPATLGLTSVLPPEITADPVSVSANPGAPASFTVTAKGSGLGYQWRRNGVALQGETGTTLTFAGVQVSDAAVYTVVVSNLGGSVTSVPATLTVDAVLGNLKLIEAPVVFSAGGNLTLEIRTDYSGAAPQQLGWSIILPPGFSYQGGQNEPGVKPQAGATGTLEWAYTTIPASGAVFTVRLAYVGGLGGLQSIYATLLYRTNAVPSTVTLPALVLSRVDSPTILRHPAALTLVAGTSGSLSVSAQGGNLSYQWYLNNQAISGATLATLPLRSVTLADGGDYKVRVNNAVTVVESTVARVTVFQVSATQALVGTGYVEGQTLQLVNTITFSGGDATMGWQTLLPAGWSFAGSAGDDGDVKPTVGRTDLLEWAWTSFPVSPLRFSVTVNVASGATGAQEIASLVSFVRSGASAQVLATPDPLVVLPVGWHSADINRDSRISLLELLRVIELYNTRNGTSRTGAYAVNAQGEDGFAPAFERLVGQSAVLTGYHSADTNRDGRIALLDLLRVIELYNFLSDRVRTGEYHRSANTEDGFASGLGASVVPASIPVP